MQGVDRLHVVAKVDHGKQLGPTALETIVATSIHVKIRGTYAAVYWGKRIKEETSGVMMDKMKELVLTGAIWARSTLTSALESLC